MIDPDLGYIQYGIDPRGVQYSQVNSIESANRTQTSFTHDALDRLIARSEPDLTSTWTYDQLSTSAAPCTATASCGKLVEATSWAGPPGTGVKDYDRVEAYDNLGRPSVTTTTLDASR